MDQSDSKVYSEALNSWVSEHPFTDGSGNTPSSEVFGGYIAAEAFKRDWAREHVRMIELGSRKINPFIWHFRLPDGWFESSNLDSIESPMYIPIAELGLVFASLQAQLSRLESAHLFVDGDIESDTNEFSLAEVEITRFSEQDDRSVCLETDSEGEIHFGSKVCEVTITGDQLNIKTSGSETTFGSPIYIRVHTIDVNDSTIVVESQKVSFDGDDSVVHLNCCNFVWRNDSLSVRPEVNLTVLWPGCESYPWHNYKTPDLPIEINDVLDERLRRLRKLLVLFRARGKGQLGKFKQAINQDRKIRGSGAAIRDRLLEEGVLVDKGRVYVLDTKELSRVLGLSFIDIRSGAVNQKTIEFLHSVEPNP